MALTTIIPHTLLFILILRTMVARITIPNSLTDTLNYNEKKVQKGVATCIGEGNFLLSVQDMNFYQKLHWLQQRNALNERASTKTIHVSLNFDPSENHSTEKLKSIADDYMLRIGFGEQPYLIYEHKDAGHPHIHIVASTIRADGSRINTHNIGRNQSEIARKAIESKYNLVPATKPQHAQTKNITPIDLTKFDTAKVEYGKSETRRSIANIVSKVIQYNFTSLPEFNAALRQFNILADRGDEEGFIFRKRGLLYRIIDANGNHIGVPIKASILPNKPTLSFLEQKFEHNKLNRDTPKLALKNSLDQTLKSNAQNLKQFTTALAEKNIYTLLRQNAEGRIYGITFVDNQNKSVFNGSEIGKNYSIAGLNKQFADSQSITQQAKSQFHNKSTEHENSLLNTLLDPIENHSLTPFHLKKKKRKKRK